MTRDDRCRQVTALLSAGFTQRRVADMVGCSESYVRDIVYDPTGEKARQRKASYRGVCKECGCSTYGGDGRTNAPTMCWECHRRLRHEDRYWTQARVLMAIKGFAREKGRPPTSREWLYGAHGQHVDGYPYTGTVQREFGSWASAIEAAGFPRPRMGQYQVGDRRGERVPTEAYLERIRTLSRDGLAPSSDCREVRNFASQLRRRGFSWAEACRLAGVTPRSRIPVVAAS